MNQWSMPAMWNIAGIVLNVGLYFAFGFFLVWAAVGPQTPLFDAVSLRGGFISGGMRALLYLFDVRNLDTPSRGDTV